MQHLDILSTLVVCQLFKINCAILLHPLDAGAQKSLKCFDIQEGEFYIVAHWEFIESDVVVVVVVIGLFVKMVVC